MDNELLLIVGMILGVLSFPSMLSAFTEGRSPRVATITIMIGGSMILWALMNEPAGFRVDDIPEIFARVIARYLL